MNKETVLWVVLGILLCLQIKSIFDKQRKTYEMGRTEEKIKNLEEKRLSDSATFAEKIRWYDSLLSVSQQMSLQLASKYQATKVIYEKVPIVINSLDREQLRIAVTDFK